jgi:pyruvate dehydrogenase E1 component alpha subunit
MIECKTFRMTGHSAHDPADYVPDHLWKEWGAQDPIVRIEKAMVERGWATEEDLQQIRSDIRVEVDQAIGWAEKSALPDASELLDGVYAEGNS